MGSNPTIHSADASVNAAKPGASVRPELVKRRSRRRLGETLIDAGLISPEQLESALAEKTRSREPLGEVLIRLKLLTEEAMKQALASQLNIPFLDLDQFAIERHLGR